MSFRRDREAGSAWRRWVTAHEAELIEIGVPREAWADELTWWRFVDHGYHPPAANARDVRFHPDDLPTPGSGGCTGSWTPSSPRPGTGSATRSGRSFTPGSGRPTTTASDRQPP